MESAIATLHGLWNTAQQDETAPMLVFHSSFFNVIAVLVNGRCQLSEGRRERRLRLPRWPTSRCGTDQRAAIHPLGTLRCGTAWTRAARPFGSTSSSWGHFRWRGSACLSGPRGEARLQAIERPGPALKMADSSCSPRASRDEEPSQKQAASSLLCHCGEGERREA